MASAGKIQHVTAGSPLKIKASEWNAIADAVNGGIRPPSETGKLLADYVRRTVRIYNSNSSAVTMQYGNVIVLTGEKDAEATGKTPTFNARIPTSGETDGVFAVVVTREIPQYKYGMAVISGAALVELATSSASGGWAVPDGTGKLRFNDSGGILRLHFVPTATTKRWAFIGVSASAEETPKGQFDLQVTNTDTGFTATVTYSTQDSAYAYAGIIQAGSLTFFPPKLSYNGTSSETSRWFYAELEYTPAESGSSGTWRYEVTSYASQQTFSNRPRLYWVLLGVVSSQTSGGYKVIEKRTPAQITVTGRWV